jgi:hypothetical protein
VGILWLVFCAVALAQTQPAQAPPPTPPTQATPQPSSSPTQPASAQSLQPASGWLSWLIETISNNGANWAIVLLTIVLAGIGIAQWRATDTANRHTLVTERAYVDISHAPPGLEMNPGDIRFSVQVKNHGRTPARVTRPVMFLQLAEADSMPEQPEYGTPASGPISAFLMPDETFNQWELRPPFPPDIVAMINNGQRHLWLIGYVDYIDKFDQRHRSGYARKYIHPPLPGSTNNLVFTTQPGYNFDIEINENGQPV